MLQYLNLKNLLLIRNYLPEILFVLLTSAVVKQHLELRHFEKEVREMIVPKLSESTNAINQNTLILEKISYIIEKKEREQRTN